VEFELQSFAFTKGLEGKYDAEKNSFLYKFFPP